MRDEDSTDINDVLCHLVFKVATLQEENNSLRAQVADLQEIVLATEWGWNDPQYEEAGCPLCGTFFGHTYGETGSPHTTDCLYTAIRVNGYLP